MKTIISLLFLWMCPLLALQAQTESDIYIMVSYLQVDSDDVDKFLNDTSQDFKRLQQNRVENGAIDSWRLYRVVLSSNPVHKYNFISVEIAPELNAFQTDTRPDAVAYKAAMQSEPILKFKIHSEIWITKAEVNSDNEAPSRYKNTNFMKAASGSLQEYLNLETEIAKPLHQHQADNNRMDGWNFYQLIFPTGSAVVYNFITADYYSNIEQIEWGITREIIEDVHPEMDVDEFEVFADSIRERVWSDLWELLEYVN